MSRTPGRKAKGEETGRRRMSREERHRQLLDHAWALIRREGTDALTLARLAEEAGVTKPLAYDHFVTRTGLLAALYKEYDVRQIDLMEEALQAGEPTLASRARVIAAAYVACVLEQGREIAGVIAALAGSPELEALRRECEGVFMERCRVALSPFAGAKPLSPAGLRAMLGAAEALSCAAASGEVSAGEAEDELREMIIAMVSRRGGDVR